ncbi:MAG: glycosyltransferase family 2 protein [Pseudomonadota bacterium]
MAKATGLLPQLSEITTRKKRKGGVKVFFCLYNERIRLEEFLAYYRKLGAREFFAVDNNSTDGSTGYLKGQRDVHLFHTRQSYRESYAGRIWTSNLCETYGAGSWCLTVDTDEFLIYPYSEHVGLPLLCEYLEDRNYQALFCLMHDYYNPGPLADAEYSEGRSIFDVCDHFDAPSSYRVRPAQLFPHVQVHGGPRPRRFWVSRNGPAMKKIPLVYWEPGFRYNHSTHSCTPVRLADVTGSLAHFKFLSNFKEFVAREIAREDRMNDSADYKRYLIGLKRRDFSFFNKRLSRHNGDSSHLIDLGAMACSQEYFDFCFDRLCRREGYAAFNPLRLIYKEEMEKRRKPVGYDSLMQVWPLMLSMINETPQIGETASASGNGDPAATARLERKLESQARSIELLSEHVKRQAAENEALRAELETARSTASRQSAASDNHAGPDQPEK